MRHRTRLTFAGLFAGRPILFDAETCARLPDSLQVDSIGEVVFNGKTVAVQVYSAGIGI